MGILKMLIVATAIVLLLTVGSNGSLAQSESANILTVNDSEDKGNGERFDKDDSIAVRHLANSCRAVIQSGLIFSITCFPPAGRCTCQGSQDCSCLQAFGGCTSFERTAAAGEGSGCITGPSSLLQQFCFRR
jgi:hypothetical protein